MGVQRSVSPVREVVEGLMQRYDLADRREQDLVSFLWDDIVGPGIARISRPAEYRQGVLFVKVKSPQWAHELTYMKAQVLANLKARLPSLTWEDVRFTAAWTSPRDFVDEGGPPVPTWPAETDLDQIALSAVDRYTIEAMVQPLSDPSLRDRLREVLHREFKSRRWRLAHGWRECGRCHALFYGPQESCDFCRMEGGPR